MKHLEGLNPKQKEVVLHQDGPLLVIAGAGAGKTKAITHRILNLIEQRIPAEKILAVTFTNKAAREMRERILNNVKPKGNSIPLISTFHSLGVLILKENAEKIGLTKYFTILDEADSISIIKEAMREKEIDPKQYDPKKIRNVISREKGKFVDQDEYQQSSSDYFSKIVGKIWNLYEEKKIKENSLDFDDLILKTVKLLKENKEVRKIYQNRWSHIHVDEYQDTNEVQYLLSKILSETHKNICVVGDADQNIYSWRGANLKNILSFEKDYSNTKVILLEENYRSTRTILEVANEIIKKNKWRPEKNLFTKNSDGEKLTLYEALDESDEADFVAIKILNIWDSTFMNGLVEPERRPENPNKRTVPDIAILYRTNFQSRVIEEAMLRYNIPYEVLGVKFFERKEIKDVLSYLRASLNPESTSDIKRIINFPRRGLGKTTLSKVFSGELESLPIKTKLKINDFYKILDNLSEQIKTSKPSEVIKFTIKNTGIENELLGQGEEGRERLENIKELATLALKYDSLKDGTGIEKLLEDASLASDQDDLILREQTAKKINRVKLMTIHASKGLEFDYVFITGLENGLFPSQRDADNTEENKEEERRLFYVALTRARKKVFLTLAGFRTIFGMRQLNTPSEFLNDLPKDLIEEESINKIKTIYI